MGQGHSGLSPAFSATGRVCGLVCGMYCPTGSFVPVGVIDAIFEPESLKLGRIQARHLHVRFQDGTLIDTDNADPLPPVLSLESESQEVTVVLALPLLRANGGNCLKPDEVAERPVRYRQSWRDVRNAFGEDTRQIAVMHPELTLRFDHQNNSDYLTCPVARLQQDSQGSWQLDETFLPPLLTIQGSRWLVTQLEQLLTQLRVRLCRLMAMRRESNERMADFAVADVSLFWLLNALNSAEPVLGQFQRNLQSPPERLYPELSRLAGSLLTFSLEHQVSAIPVWQHEQLNAVFPPLFDLLGDLLEASLPSRVVALSLDYDPRLHFWQARLHDPRLREGADYYLSVRSPIPVAQLQEQFPRQCKVGSPDHVRGIVNSSRVGVPLTPLRHVPAAIPLRLENQYFSLDLSHPLATEMLQSGTCMFYVPGMLGEPELELFAVLRT